MEGEQINEEVVLSPLELLEKRLCDLIETKEGEIKSYINKLNLKMQGNVNKVSEKVVKSEQKIRQLNSLLNKYEEELKTKVDITSLDLYKKDTNNEIQINSKRLQDNIYECKEMSIKNKINIKRIEDNNREAISQIENNIKDQIANYLKIEEFNKCLVDINNTYNNLKESITLLQNNINPCALLKSDKEIILDIETRKGTPNNFLKYLFNQFKVEAKGIIETQNKRIKYTESVIETLQKNLNANLYIAAKKAVAQLKAKDEVNESSNKELIQEILNKKCDLSELQLLNDLKANKIDLERLEYFLQELNENVKYIAVMINELMQILVSDLRETKTGKTNKLTLVIQQLSLLYKSMPTREVLLGLNDTRQPRAKVSESLIGKIKANTPMFMRKESGSHKNLETYDEHINKVKTNNCYKTLKQDEVKKKLIRRTGSHSRKICYKKR